MSKLRAEWFVPGDVLAYPSGEFVVVSATVDEDVAECRTAWAAHLRDLRPQKGNPKRYRDERVS